MKKFLSYLLVLLTLVNSITPAFAATTYTDSTEHVDYIEHSDEYDSTIVYAEIGSEFKVTIPKHITLDGNTKQGAYNVLVEGDIAGNEYVKVVPETYFLLYSKNKNSIPATVSQDKTGWSYSDFGTKANGLIETEGMTAGAWNGTFYFNIKLESSVKLDSSITGGTNNPDTGEENTPAVDANNVTGAQKKQLLDALEESGRVEEADDIDTMINIKTPDNTLNGIENITIDTTGVANPGDTVVIVQEKENEWDYISTETVTNNNEVKVPIKSTRPVSFVQTQPDGTVHVHKYTEDIIKEPSCTEDGTLSMLCECFKEYIFTIPASHNLEVVEKKDENGELINRYYECTNCAYSILNLTNLFAGNELSHDCNNYLINKYNSTHHWKECSVCNSKQSTVTHSYTRTWALGYESCVHTNYATDICNDCGYSTTYRKPCNWNGNSYVRYSSMMNYSHVKQCSVCNSVIYYDYYYNGKLYSHSASNEHTERCYYYENGIKTLATCKTTGKSCAVCGQSFTGRHLPIWSSGSTLSISDDNLTTKGTQVLQCISCEEVFATSVSTNVHWLENGEWKTKLTSIITAKPGNTINSGSEGSSTGASYYKNATFTQSKTTSNGVDVLTMISTRTLNTNSIVAPYYDDHQFVSIKTTDGKSYSFAIYSGRGERPEYSAPIISNIIQTPISTKNGWSTGMRINVTGTEDHASIINYALYDSNNNLLNNGKASVTNKKYNIIITPLVEANEIGKEFKLVISDVYGNTTTKLFTIAKTDSKSPTINSINSSTNWSKTKNALFTAIDEGSGNVKIAFNNINEYVDMDKSGTTYTKEYQFSGDVYGEIIAAIYYTDAVENVATQFVKVYNLDNTAPTISNVSVDGKQITVTANDLNKQLNMEGSGVSKYALTWTSAPPQDSDWQDSNILNVSTNGTYYIWVKDAVGNISECYQVRIIL